MFSRWNIIFWWLLSFPAALFAQGHSGGLAISTDPQGAEVVLRGDLTFSGMTPISFTQGLDGWYKIEITRYGYEAYKSAVFIEAGKPVSLTVALKKKTLLKGVVRSCLIPGWGQFYSDQKLKGFIYLTLAAAAAGAYLIADADFDDKNDQYDRLRSEYNRLTRIEDMKRLYPLVAEAKKDAYDSENVRRTAIGVTVGVWSLNLLDLLFHFPGEGGTVAVGSLSVKPHLGPDHVCLNLAYGF
jgi:hypothetical protein